MKKTILSIVLALSVPALFAGDLTKKGEFQANFGGGHAFEQGGNGTNYGVFGANLGWGVAKQLTAFGEFGLNYHSGSDQFKVYDYDGGVKLSLMKSDHVEPYVLAAFGGAHFPHGQYGKAVHAGGGARFYMGGKAKKWGLAPEVRWVRYMDSGDHTNTMRYTGGVFVQW